MLPESPASQRTGQQLCCGPEGMYPQTSPPWILDFHPACHSALTSTTQSRSSSSSKSPSLARRSSLRDLGVLLSSGASPFSSALSILLSSPLLQSKGQPTVIPTQSPRGPPSHHQNPNWTAGKSHHHLVLIKDAKMSWKRDSCLLNTTLPLPGQPGAEFHMEN